MQFVHNARVLKHFCHRQLYIFFSDYWNTLIDSLSWPLLGAAVFGYVFPHMGMEKGYGSFALIGCIVALTYFVVIEQGGGMTSDFDGARKIDFELGLPVSTPFIIFKTGITSTIQSFLMTLPLPFMGKLVLWYRFDMSQFSLFKFLLVYLLLNATFSFFAMWMAGFVKSKDILHFRIRVIDVMFFAGCFLFTWQKLYEVHKIAAYAMLINPMTYAICVVFLYGSQIVEEAIGLCATEEGMKLSRIELA